MRRKGLQDENAKVKKGNGGRMAGRNPELTELVFVLDRSGSMTGMERAVIDGFNRLVEKQRKEPGRAVVSVELFDDRFDVVYDRAELGEIRPLTEREYYTRGSTALLDAVGRAIRHIARKQREANPAERPGHTLFVINTDGYENASREFTRERIRKMVREEEQKYGWEFLFLGANIDSHGEAGTLGIRAEMTCNVVADAAGWAAQYESVSEAASSTRRAGSIGAAWRRRVDEDYDRRGRK
jgi:uncharacterized protein YegL